MTIVAGNLDSSAFNIQGIGFATGLAGPLVGCRDVSANNHNIDTGGVYGTAGAVVVFNTHSGPGDPNECTYDGCMDQNSSSFFSTVYNGDTYYATTPLPCDYEGCNDPLAWDFNITCGGYDLTPLLLSITITNNGCCNYPDSWDCDPVAGGCTTVTGGTGAFVVCHDYYNPLAPASTPSGCYATPADAQTAACSSGNCPSCGSNSVPGCTDVCAPNYDALADCDDGSCDPIVYGCVDDGNIKPGTLNSFGNSIWPSTNCLGYACAPYDSYDSSWSYKDLTNTQLNLNLGNDIAADNYDANATHMDCNCEYHGCTDPQAINFENFYTHEDGSCIYAGCTDPASVNGVDQFTHPNPILYDNNGNIITTWYVNPIDATVENGNCVVFGCNLIDTPNVLPWGGTPIKETVIIDNALEEAIESWNEGGSNNQMLGLYLGHAGSWDDITPPLTGPGSLTGLGCGIPSTFANNLNHPVDYGNGLGGDCSVEEFLSHMQWTGNNGSFTYDGLCCTQGFANAWGPFDDTVWNSGTNGGHNDGFYLQRPGYPPLTGGIWKTIYTPYSGNITDLSGIQDFALNPGFKRLVIHNQYITNFIHTETDPTSPYYQLDMLDTLFQHAPNFDCLSLKSSQLGTGEVLDLTGWANCSVVELTDLFYDEVNINHIDNPKCSQIFIVNDDTSSNNYGNKGGNGPERNTFASGDATGYSQDLSIDWTVHTPGTIANPAQIVGNSGLNTWYSDTDESYRQTSNTGGYGYPKGFGYLDPSLVGKMYNNINDAIGEHFPPQSPAFSGWSLNGGFTTGAADRFVPQYKLAPMNPETMRRVGTNTISTRRGSSEAWPGQILSFYLPPPPPPLPDPGLIGSQRLGFGNAAANWQGAMNTAMFNYQGNIQGDVNMGTVGYNAGFNGFGWIYRPSSENLGTNPHGYQVSSFYGGGNAGSGGFEDPTLYNPADPSRKIDLELTIGKALDLERTGFIIQNKLVLINLKNLRHVWLGPDWEPQYSMNRPNSYPNPIPNQFGNYDAWVFINVNGVATNNRGFSIKGCGGGQPVYVHTSGRAMEFQKRYGTNDQTALNQFNEPIWSQEGEDFFLEYFDSNVVFVD